MNPAPSLFLPACPKCSNVFHATRPMWRLARHTTAKERRAVYIFAGCEHAQPFSPTSRLVREEEEWKAVEDAWIHAAGQIFAAVTEGWSERSIDAFRRGLEGMSALPGATDPLPLEEAKPADTIGDVKKAVEIVKAHQKARGDEPNEIHVEGEPEDYL